MELPEGAVEAMAELDKLSDNVPDSYAVATALLFLSQDSLKVIVDEVVKQSTGTTLNSLIGTVDDLTGRTEWLSHYLAARGGYEGTSDEGHTDAVRFADAAVRDR